MSREHLYKAKRISDGEWVEGFYFCLIHDDNRHAHHFIIPLGTDLSFGTPIEKIQVEVDTDTICEYTGLPDKNKRKIFEGDICYFSVFDYDGHYTQYKGIVVYSGSRFMLWNSKDSEYYGSDGGFDLDWTVSQDDELEVIGNIFDNPELLEGVGE